MTLRRLAILIFSSLSLSLFAQEPKVITKDGLEIITCEAMGQQNEEAYFDAIFEYIEKKDPDVIIFKGVSEEEDFSVYLSQLEEEFDHFYFSHEEIIASSFPLHRNVLDSDANTQMANLGEAVGKLADKLLTALDEDDDEDEKEISCDCHGSINIHFNSCTFYNKNSED